MEAFTKMTGNNTSKQHVCDTCGKSFSRKNDLYQHKKTHLGIKAFKCGICQKVFARNAHLTRHKQSHIVKQVYECEKCKATFKRKHFWERHTMLHLKGGLQCDECNQVFTKPKNLKHHKKLQHPQKETFPCSECDNAFTSMSEFIKHRVTTHVKEQVHKCGECNAAFARESSLKHHILRHVKESHYCDECKEVFSSKKHLNHHRKLEHATLKRKLEKSPVKSFEKKSSALGVFSVYELIPSEEGNKDIFVFFNEVRPLIVERIEAEISEKKGLKWYIVCNISMIRTSNDGFEENITPHFRSNCIIELKKDTILAHVEDAFEKVHKSFEEFTHRGSGWVIRNIMSLEINCAKYRPIY